MTSHDRDLAYYVAYSLAIYTSKHLEKTHSTLKCKQPEMLQQLDTLEKSSSEICIPVMLQGELNQYLVFLFSKKIIHAYYQTASIVGHLETEPMLKDAAAELVNVVCGHMIKKRIDAPRLDFKLLPETNVCMNHARMAAFHLTSEYGRIMIVLLDNTQKRGS